VDTGTRRPRRLAREDKTITVMIDLYCRDHHGAALREAAAAGASRGGHDLCPECRELLEYARVRLDRCRYGEAKPTCARCDTHCYRPALRERVREVMRYSGPRMMRRHPILAMAHLLDGRKTPAS
jgi:hypothetical protein